MLRRRVFDWTRFERRAKGCFCVGLFSLGAGEEGIHKGGVNEDLAGGGTNPGGVDEIGSFFSDIGVGILEKVSEAGEEGWHAGGILGGE